MVDSVFTIFPDYAGEVARIGLVGEIEAGNLDYLVTQILAHYYSLHPDLKPENRLTKVANRLGVFGTYDACWVDEQTKLEFVAKIHAKTDRGQDPDYVAFRKLKGVSDTRGTLIPFGKKANITQEIVERVLDQQKQRVLTGQLSWQPSS